MCEFTRREKKTRGDKTMTQKNKHAKERRQKYVKVNISFILLIVI